MFIFIVCLKMIKILNFWYGYLYILKSFVKCIMCMSIYLLNFVKCVLKVCICIDVKWEYFKGFVDFKCGFNFYNR